MLLSNTLKESGSSENLLGKIMWGLQKQVQKTGQ